jgi:hypothetical protein
VGGERNVVTVECQTTRGYDGDGEARYVRPTMHSRGRSYISDRRIVIFFFFFEHLIGVKK